jgi:hypothetical protein
MQIDLPAVVAVTVATAKFLKKPVQDVAGKVIQDGYDHLKKLIGEKAGASPEVGDALTKLDQKPESQARTDLLIEELVGKGIEKDGEILAAVEALLKALPAGSTSQTSQVSITQRGRNNRALVAGRDIITTERHTTRVEFTPDERHISPEQGERLRKLVEKLAMKIAKEDGRPNFKDAWNRLYGQFNIGTFRELKKENFEAAVSYLQTQSAINRSRLRRSNPQAYLNSLYAPIWAKAKTLGWDKPTVYTFAQEKLELKKPISTLTKLGSIQLKHLYEIISRQ